MQTEAPDVPAPGAALEARGLSSASGESVTSLCSSGASCLQRDFLYTSASASRRKAKTQPWRSTTRLFALRL